VLAIYILINKSAKQRENLIEMIENKNGEV
jgi:hypothetical protein